ncbi:MAG: hypothetical protein HYW49_05155 [Deltaproteobacteria bacterium]|nr:hypothetical protein [Deltaproteobacteria bacterium]
MRKRRLAALACLAMFAAACAGKDARKNQAPEAAPAVRDEYGPELPPQAPAAEEPKPAGPQPVLSPAQDGYALILGPGLARTLALVGVLRAFEENGVKIRSVTGVEMGALMAVLWAGANANKLEWEMFKFNRDVFLDRGFLSLGAKTASGRSFETYLEKAFGDRPVDGLRFPTYVVHAAGHAAEGGEKIILGHSGLARDLVRAAVGIPPVEMVRAISPGKILCVDVLGAGNDFSPADHAEESLAALMKTVSSLARESLKQCDEAIRVPVDGIGLLAFEARSELIDRGRTAVQKWIEERPRPQ